MGREITVILRDGTEFTYKNARVVEGNRTWIYQVNKNESPEELLAFIDPNHIRDCIRKKTDIHLDLINRSASR